MITTTQTPIKPPACWPEDGPEQAKASRSLVSPELFDRLANRIRLEHPELAAGMAERILEQALAFLGACAVTTEPIGPSELVDIGWHTFILHTADYADFCDRIAGRFIHHVPDEPDGGVGSSLAASVAAIRASGFTLDRALWFSGAECTQCYAGCSDSPTR